jgi:hypothetical protein
MIDLGSLPRDGDGDVTDFHVDLCQTTCAMPVDSRRSVDK